MVDINKYVNLEQRNIDLGSDGNYLEPEYIVKMITSELQQTLSYDELKDVSKNGTVYVTDEQIIEFLQKTMDEENPGLKAQLSKKRKRSTNILKWSEEDMQEMFDEMDAASKASRYSYDQYTLEYSKKYIGILQIKLSKLFTLVDDLLNKRARWADLEDLDIAINEQGNVWYNDVIRIAECIIYNANELLEGLTMANTLETYLTFKQEKCIIDMDGVHYPYFPKEELQIKDLGYQFAKEFIAFSEKQLEELSNEKIRNLEAWINESFDD